MALLRRKMQYVTVAGVVVVEDDKVLLSQHSDEGFWKFPMGELETFKGTLEEAAQREVEETMGFLPKIITPLKPYIIWQEKQATVLIHYLAERKGEVKPNEKVRDWGWFPVYKLPDYLAPNIKPLLDEYLYMRGQGILKCYLEPQKGK